MVSVRELDAASLQKVRSVRSISVHGLSLGVLRLASLSQILRRH